MEDPRPMIHIRLPKALIKSIDHVAVDLETDRARAIEHLLESALNSAERQTPELVGAGR